MGLEYGLKTASNWVFSTTLTFGIPSGKSQAGSDGSYQTGDGEFNQLLQFNLGSGFEIGKQNFYLKSYFDSTIEPKDFRMKFTVILKQELNF